MSVARPPRIAVVIPCYAVRTHIIDVLDAIGPEVAAIYVVDDACPEATGQHVSASCADPRVRVVTNAKHLGVGGATMRDYGEALAGGLDILVTLARDGQMDAGLIASLPR